MRTNTPKLLQRNLLTIIVLFGLVVVVTTVFSSLSLRTNLTNEFINRGTDIADSIASTSTELMLNRDASTIQSRIDSFLDPETGVAYIFVVNDKNEFISHTFVPEIPQELREIVADETNQFAIQNLEIADKGDFINISAPVLAGTAGNVHVGMDLGIISGRIQSVIFNQIILVALVFIVSVFLAYVQTIRISRPLLQLTEYVQSFTSSQTSSDEFAQKEAEIQVVSQRSDEVGQLAQNFQQMVTEVRSYEQGLENRVAARTQDLNLAAEIGRQVTQAFDVDEVLVEATTLMKDQFGLYQVQIYLSDQERKNLVLRASDGHAGSQLLDAGHTLPIDENSLNGSAAFNKDVVIVADTLESESFRPHPLLPDTRSETAVPLLVSDKVVGVLDLQSNEPNSFTEESLPAFVTLAGQLAIAIENSNLFTEASHQAERLSTLNEMSTAIAIASTINDIYKIAGQYTQHIVGGQRASLGMLDPDGQTFEVLGLSGEKGAMPIGTHLPVDKTVVGLCIRENRLIIDGDGQPEKYADAKQLAEQGLISIMNAPIVVSGKTIGAINIASNQANAFGTQEDTLMKQIASLLSGAIENRQLLAQTQEALTSVKTNESLMRTIIDSTPDWIFIKNTEHRYQLVNQSYAEAMGLTPETFIGKNDLEAGFPEEIVKGNPQKGIRGFWADDQEIMDKGEIKVIDEEPAIVNGESRTLSTIKVPLKDAEDNVTGIVGFVHDITTIKQAEATMAKQAAELQTVAELSTALSKTLDTEQLLQDIVNRTKESFDLYHTHIYLLDENSNTLTLTSGAGNVGAEMVAIGHNIPMDHEHSLVARAAQTKEGVIVNNVAADPAFLPNTLLPDTKSEMAVPVMAANKILGVLDLQADKVDHFTNTDINIQTTLATQIAIALENASAFEQANEQAAIIQNATNIIATFSLDGTLRTINESGLSRLGYDALEDVLGKNILSFFPPDLGAERREETMKVVQEHGFWQGEAMLLTSSGEKFPVDQTVSLIRDEDGQAKMLAFNMTDITERKKAEEVIRRNETLMRTIIDSTPDWIFVKDNQHRYQMVNKAYANTTNLEPEALIGKTLLDIDFPQETAEMLIAEDEKLMESEEALVVSEEEILLGEETRYQTITKVLLRDASGQVESMVGFAHDVTKQVVAAEEQKQLQQELEAQLERVNALQSAMTREGWQAFMTATAGKRAYQGFEFNQDGIKTLTSQDLSNSKSAALTNGKNEVVNPVTIQGTTVGKIGVRNPSGEPLSDEQRGLLASLTNQVAEALDRARLFEETELGRQEIEEQAAELSTVNEISELVSTQLNINDLVNDVGDRLIETFSANSVYIALVEEKTRLITFPYFTNIIDGPLNLSPRSLDEQGGFTAKIYSTKQPLIHNTSEEDIVSAALAEGAAVIDSSNDSNSYIGVPLIIGDYVIGVIGINGQQDRRKYDEDDIPLLTTLSSTIAIALQNAQQFEATQRRANREAMVNEISQKIQSAPTIESAMQTAVAELGKALNLKHAVVKLNKSE